MLLPGLLGGMSRKFQVVLALLALVLVYKLVLQD